jgi:hypothetical protein
VMPGCAAPGNGIQQRLSLGLGGATEDLGGLGTLHDLFEVHDHNAVTDVFYHAQIVGDKHSGGGAAVASTITVSFWTTVSFSTTVSLTTTVSTTVSLLQAVSRSLCLSPPLPC